LYPNSLKQIIFLEVINNVDNNYKWSKKIFSFPCLKEGEKKMAEKKNQKKNQKKNGETEKNNQKF